MAKKRGQGPAHKTGHTLPQAVGHMLYGVALGASGFVVIVWLIIPGFFHIIEWLTGVKAE